MRVLIVGDVHGCHQPLADALWQVRVDYRIAAAIQVGDFGLYPELLARLRAENVRFAVPLHVIDGNHEDHRWLQRAVRDGAAETWPQETNLIYQPRPSVARFGSTCVGFLGGALHVDRPQEHNLLARCPNYILRRQRAQAAALFNRERPELIVTHSCPAGIGIGLRGTPEMIRNAAEHITAAGFDPGPLEDCGEVELRLLWGELRYRPRAWVFGHFHRTHWATLEGTCFASISADLDSAGRSLALWDTEEKKLLLCPADPSAEASREMP